MISQDIFPWILLQSRTQSPQALWPVVCGQKKLWGNWKKIVFDCLCLATALERISAVKKIQYSRVSPGDQLLAREPEIQDCFHSKGQRLNNIFYRKSKFRVHWIDDYLFITIYFNSVKNISGRWSHFSLFQYIKLSPRLVGDQFYLSCPPKGGVLLEETVMKLVRGLMRL